MYAVAYDCALIPHDAACSSHICHVIMQEMVSHVISSHIEGQGSKAAAHTMLKLQSGYNHWQDTLVRMQK